MGALASDEVNAAVNWSKDGPCRECQNAVNWEWQAGSYASELAHFEEALGAPLPGPRTDLRLLILFQDARSSDKFELASPFEPVAELGDDRHRYFCLTKKAWEDLGLDEPTGSPVPRWPDEGSAPAYLARYLKRTRNSWSYDGFLAYLLYRFRPEDAYITNLAKCYAGDRTQVFRNCAKKHLSTEISDFRPNAMISFTGRANTRADLGRLTGADLSKVGCFMRFYHPAVWGARRKKLKMRDQISEHEAELSRLKCEARPLLECLERDMKQVLAGQSGRRG
ncbi:MAG: hypothetical protein JXA87_12480 [Thermoleophilia bacterium]|nr:hypothetical protein [Thermoleophilia bacterium]